MQQIVLRFLNLAYLHILKRKNCKLTSFFYAKSQYEINKTTNNLAFCSNHSSKKCISRQDQ